LDLPGDPYTLFCDYDQIENKKLTTLDGKQKAKWFERRLGMTYIEPLRRIWKEDVVSEKLLSSKMEPNTECSFSIASMGIMLGIIEALGSFRRPDLADQEKHWEMFLDFLGVHMRNWNRSIETNVSVPQVLWKSFRNGITHGLRMGEVPQRGDLWASLEHHTNFTDKQKRRYESHGQLLRVCPEDFFDDLYDGTKDYFEKLSSDQDLFANFEKRFNKVYPADT